MKLATVALASVLALGSTFALAQGGAGGGGGGSAGGGSAGGSSAAGSAGGNSKAGGTAGSSTTTGSSMDGSTTGGAGANPNNTMSPSGNSPNSFTKRFNPNTDRARLGHEEISYKEEINRTSLGLTGTQRAHLRLLRDGGRREDTACL